MIGCQVSGFSTIVQDAEGSRWEDESRSIRFFTLPGAENVSAARHRRACLRRLGECPPLLPDPGAVGDRLDRPLDADVRDRLHGAARDRVSGRRGCSQVDGLPAPGTAGSTRGCGRRKQRRSRRQRPPPRPRHPAQSGRTGLTRCVERCAATPGGCPAGEPERQYFRLRQKLTPVVVGFGQVWAAAQPTAGHVPVGPATLGRARCRHSPPRGVGSRGARARNGSRFQAFTHHNALALRRRARNVRAAGTSRWSPTAPPVTSTLEERFPDSQNTPRGVAGVENVGDAFLVVTRSGYRAEYGS